MTDEHPDAASGANPPAPGSPAGAGGRVISGRYELLRSIGRGAMGVVWEARDILLGRTVAIKEVLLPPGLPPDEQRTSSQRTLREARAIAGLSHPNVITLFDVLDIDGRPWIVMERLQARSLAEVIATDGPPSVPRVATIGLAVLSALEAAHEAGIVHRDIKPGNILLLDDGRVKLTDFGIARADGDSRLTRSGFLVGSPAYVAPEVVRGGVVGPPADMWGLGCTMYAAQVGHAPFDRGELQATLAAVLREPNPPLGGTGALGPVIDGLLDKDPGRRLTAVETRRLLLGVARAFDRPGGAGGYPSGQQRIGQSPPGSGQAPVTGVPGRAQQPAPPRTDRGRLASTPAYGQPPVRLPQSDPGPPTGPRPQASQPRHSGPQPVQQAHQHGGAGGGAPGPPSGARPIAYTEVDPRRRRTGRTVTAVILILLLCAGTALGAYWLTGKLTNDRTRNASDNPSTSAASTSAPSTSAASTSAPSTSAPSTSAPSTSAPSTSAPSTSAPSTSAPASRSSTPSRSSPPRSTTAKPKPKPSNAIPAGYTKYDDGRGFTVGVPDGWHKNVVRDGVVDLNRPGGNGYIRLISGTVPSAGVVANLQEGEREFSSGHSGYQRIRIDSVDYRGWPAGMWEFTYTGSDGVARHVQYLSFVTNGVNFALYISAPSGDFSALLPALDVAKRTFTVG